jgi:hypothetical protein
MNSTRGHQLVVNEYFAECLRKAKEWEAERDDPRRHVHGPDSVAARAPDDTSPPALKPA